MKMQLLVKANKPPSLTLTSQAATFAAPANVTAFVVTKNMTLINVFTLNVVCMMRMCSNFCLGFLFILVMCTLTFVICSDFVCSCKYLCLQQWK